MLSSLSGPELLDKRLTPQSTGGHDARAAKANPPPPLHEGVSDERGAAGHSMLSTQAGEDAAGRRPMLEPDDEPVESDCIHIHLSCSPDALTAGAGGSADSLPLDAGVDEERPRWMTVIPGLAAVLAGPTRVHSSTFSALAPLAEEPTASSTLDVEGDKLEAAVAAEQAGSEAIHRAGSCDSQSSESTFEKRADCFAVVMGCLEGCHLGTISCLCACCLFLTQ
jgi:hypothetical protein